MSYSLIGHFVDVKNKKVICSAELGFMKNLNERRYSNDFEGVTPTGTAHDEDYPEITRYRSIEFIGYFKKSFLDDDEFYGAYKEKIRKEMNTEAKAYVFLDGKYEPQKEKLEKYSANLSLNELMNKGDDFDKKYILLYRSEIKDSGGTWFKASDFAGVQDSIKKDYEEKKARFSKLNSMKDTKEWFEMSETGQNNLLEEISYISEDLEDVEWKYDAIVKMNNILDFITEDLGFRYNDEDGCTRYSWKYNDNRDVEIYIEVD